MNITDAVDAACKEPTLIDALSWICVWESERAIKQAKKNLVDADGKGWDTCFKFCIQAIFEKYESQDKCCCPQGSLCEFFKKTNESCLYGKI